MFNGIIEIETIDNGFEFRAKGTGIGKGKTYPGRGTSDLYLEVDEFFEELPDLLRKIKELLNKE